jgi:hypothetical protein
MFPSFLVRCLAHLNHHFQFYIISNVKSFAFARDADLSPLSNIVPEAKGGSDSIHNLRPLQWYNNASRQDGPLTCPISSYGNQNYKKVG